MKNNNGNDFRGLLVIIPIAVIALWGIYELYVLVRNNWIWFAIILGAIGIGITVYQMIKRGWKLKVTWWKVPPVNTTWRAFVFFICCALFIVAVHFLKNVYDNTDGYTVRRMMEPGRNAQAPYYEHRTEEYETAKPKSSSRTTLPASREINSAISKQLFHLGDGYPYSYTHRTGIDVYFNLTNEGTLHLYYHNVRTNKDFVMRISYDKNTDTHDMSLISGSNVVSDGDRIIVTAKTDIDLWRVIYTR